MVDGLPPLGLLLPPLIHIIDLGVVLLIRKFVVLKQARPGSHPHLSVGEDRLCPGLPFGAVSGGDLGAGFEVSLFYFSFRQNVLLL